MRRRTLQPSSRLSSSLRDSTTRRQSILLDQGVWERLDQVQELGDIPGGHDGCVNALSWSDDGLTLLSGSDDKRICIWGADTTPHNTSDPGPHPLRLLETIATGHRANIFSAKYLPNTSSPTIVTCAGDREVRVFDVERLSRMESGGGRADLDGRSGPGVQVLRCHHDRTKRIATENSPFLFLTVSEDGTVRQHDLRRPHICRSECPEPLFHAPRGVDLYSLSVSTVTPHIFAVAGRTDCAFICDRRMPVHQTPSWGSHTKSSGQVHCVRRLGIPEHEWGTVETTPEGRTIRRDRHITSVKMSPDKADEVICAFAHHSTALFSIHDDPSSSSVHSSSPPTVINQSNHKSNAGPTHSATNFLRSPASQPPSSLPNIAEAGPSRLGEPQSERSSPGKRRSSRSPSPPAGPSRTARPRLGMVAGGRNPMEEEDDDRREMRMEYEAEDEDDDRLESLMRGLRDGNLSAPLDRDSRLEEQPETHPAQQRSNRFGLPLRRRPVDWDHSRNLAMEMGDEDDLPDELDDDDVGEDGLDEVGADQEEDDGEDDDDDDDDEDDDDMLDEDEDDEDDDDDYDDYGSCPLSNAGEYGGVELIYPRRYYKGARNVETVKDCNFLGAMSDKVASGSDDGNFFVWDKATGRLEGIWRGDGDVVNVMEQHPTLPLIAVSGIDHTVKVFGPPTTPITTSRSKIRTHNSDSILRANMEPPQLVPRTLGHAGIMQLLASRGLIGDGEGGDPPPGCATQ